MESRKLYKSSSNRMLTGVCGGIAEYFNIDPTIVRLLCVLIGCSGAGVVAYIAAAVIIPDPPAM